MIGLYFLHKNGYIYYIYLYYSNIINSYWIELSVFYRLELVHILVFWRRFAYTQNEKRKLIKEILINWGTLCHVKIILSCSGAQVGVFPVIVGFTLAHLVVVGLC